MSFIFPNKIKINNNNNNTNEIDTDELFHDQFIYILE